MKWRKLGHLYACSNLHSKLSSHSANPLPVLLDKDIYRIYYSARDIYNRSSVSFVEIDIRKKKIISKINEPVFQHGSDKSFYSHGVSVGNSYCIKGKRYFVFMAWQVREGLHWRGVIGRLRNDDANLFLDPNRVFMGIDEEDSISISYPFVLYDKGVYKMWYGSTIKWSLDNNEMLHVIKYAVSANGVNWEKQGISIPYEIGVAQAFSRPSVIKDINGYHMWFSYRPGDGTKYRIGYAKSSDGVSWIRYNESGITVSDSGWDSEMICYPFVFDHDEDRYMLYNGNDFGKTGFGLAILEAD